MPAFKINAGVACNGDLEALDCDEDADVEEGLRSLDLGAAAGVSFAAGPFGVDLRYTRSLRSIADEFEDGSGAPEIFNSVLSVGALYRFGR